MFTLPKPARGGENFKICPLRPVTTSKMRNLGPRIAKRSALNGHLNCGGLGKSKHEFVTCYDLNPPRRGEKICKLAIWRLELGASPDVCVLGTWIFPKRDGLGRVGTGAVTGRKSKILRIYRAWDGVTGKLLLGGCPAAPTITTER